MGKMTFILGGARSGKSAFAQRLAGQRGAQVAYVATAEALDPEMAARIAAHRQARPAGWITLELPRQAGERLHQNPPQADLIILDCLTLLVSNALLSVAGNEDAPDEATTSAVVEAEVSALLHAIQESSAEWVVVSNEVGMGLVPSYPLGRLYRDLLGKANVQLAQAADEAYFLVAGLPLPLHQMVAPGFEA
ncbi:MAG: bifunctional adenosylcobinamide kinase/adenosylcobinamide-phosphate guanylyltransferase [Anaerolineales bacterium]|nr:bifunctional adenosylcobinamide kinase/adenosylcobinamide-phosphate guanylyltransferase [Anaerolineales bacterium]